MPTLIEISEDLLQLEEALENCDGDEDAAGLVDQWLAACALEAEKLDHYAALITELEKRAEARKAEAKRLADRARVDTNRSAFLKERLKVHFLRHGRKVVETRRYRITHALNGGLLPLLLDVEAEALPEAYRVEIVEHRPNLEALRAALDASEPLAFARYGERGSAIRIR